jgi:retinoblastoma-like protein 1
MGKIFCVKYAEPSEDCPGSHIDFAKKRLQLGEMLYYKELENIMRDEMRRKQALNAGRGADFSVSCPS